MNIDDRKSKRRRDQALIRGVVALGLLAAGVLVYCLSRINPQASIFPGILLGLMAGGVALRSRARSRQQWSAAWEAYADQEASRGSFEAHPGQNSFPGRHNPNRMSRDLETA
jgi:high-affinity Fe2+/Pb2+ permease